EPNIKNLWLRLRNEDHSLLQVFENFVSNVSSELKRSKTDFNILETALQSKANDYDENVRRLFEETEAQIKLEKSRITQKEKQKERELKEKLEVDLSEKEKQLEESLGKQIEMEQKLFRLNLLEYQQKQENERLLKEKAMLEEELHEKNKSLQDSKSFINSLVQQTKEEKKNRAKQALKITENIAIERETLIRELELLKEINKKLQDERDEIELRRVKCEQTYLQAFSLKSQNRRVLSKKTSQFAEFLNLFKLFLVYGTSNNTQKADKRGSKILSKQGSILSNYIGFQVSHDLEDSPFDPVNIVKADYYSEDEPTEEVNQIFKNKKQVSPTVSTQSNDNVNNSSINPNPTATDIFNVPANATPQRVFKIVFIGDSGVGKTSFVQRFCNNTFRESFSTTIGVDFQVKSIILDNRVIALQLWDTAGQERYRSITKQYFRKADGVICMYDITSEQSFKNLRNWISSMKESASEDCVLVVIGNKTDLCPNDEKRVVRNKDGAGLAAEYESLFFETSSKESKCILEAMESIARILQEKEDKQIEDVLNLRVKEKKKGCCS
ncbi:unnamed protein product, partial [Brachionus calyciflorus]